MAHYLKTWGDRWAFDAEIKGSRIQISPKLIIVTSNYTIAELFPSDIIKIRAIERRYQRFNISVERDTHQQLIDTIIETFTKKEEPKPRGGTSIETEEVRNKVGELIATGLWPSEAALIVGEELRKKRKTSDSRSADQFDFLNDES